MEVNDDFSFLSYFFFLFFFFFCEEFARTLKGV